MRKYPEGTRGSRLYRVWDAMNQRTRNPNACGYKDYGGRGISVCKEWRDFGVFMKWALLNGYSDDLYIDRIEVNGNYEPNNIRFVTISISQFNRRKRRDFDIYPVNGGRWGVYIKKRPYLYFFKTCATIEEARVLRDEVLSSFWGKEYVA